MFISLIILLLITIGGAALTYLFAEDQTFLWRFSAGNMVGSAIFGIVGFLLACLIGLSNATVYIALLITLLPLLLYKKDSVQKRFRYDKQMAKSRFQGTSFKKFFRFLYYVSIFIMLWLFFERAMLVNENGIFTGASQNLGRFAVSSSERFFHLPTDKIFRRKVLRMQTRNLHILLSRI